MLQIYKPLSEIWRKNCKTYCEIWRLETDCNKKAGSLQKRIQKELKELWKSLKYLGLSNINLISNFIERISKIYSFYKRLFKDLFWSRISSGAGSLLTKLCKLNIIYKNINVKQQRQGYKHDKQKIKISLRVSFLTPGLRKMLWNKIFPEYFD